MYIERGINIYIYIYIFNSLDMLPFLTVLGVILEYGVGISLKLKPLQPWMDKVYGLAYCRSILKLAQKLTSILIVKKVI